MSAITLCYSSLSFPFSDRATFGADLSSPSPSSPSPSSSSSPTFSSSLPCFSSSSLSMTLCLFLDKPDSPASGISGGVLRLLAASVMSQSNLRLKWQCHLAFENHQVLAGKERLNGPSEDLRRKQSGPGIGFEGEQSSWILMSPE
ncbi:hypothetical protein EV359DRAFT_88078 [Lentinula novae-zelandiae]|nr:hypothetical protein EV359DRAFT_88078 [Lentinula novae-zelandiae]